MVYQRFGRNGIEINFLRTGHAPGSLPVPKEFPHFGVKNENEIRETLRADPNAQAFDFVVQEGGLSQRELGRKSDVGLWIDNALYTPAFNRAILVNAGTLPVRIGRIYLDMVVGSPGQRILVALPMHSNGPVIPSGSELDTAVGSQRVRVALPMHSNDGLVIPSGSKAEMKLRQPIAHRGGVQT